MQKFLKIISVVVSLLMAILSGIWMVKNSFPNLLCVSFLSYLSALVGALINLRKSPSPPWPKTLLYIFGCCCIIGVIFFSVWYVNQRIVFKILDPVSDAHVEANINVMGNYRNVPLGYFIWVVVQDKTTGTFYLSDAKSGAKEGASNGTWYSVDVPVGSFADFGKEFDIWALLVDPGTDSTIRRYITNTTILQPKFLLPSLVNTKVNVIRNFNRTQ